jgi:hypothetical protein
MLSGLQSILSTHDDANSAHPARVFHSWIAAQDNVSVHSLNGRLLVTSVALRS